MRLLIIVVDIISGVCIGVECNFVCFMAVKEDKTDKLFLVSCNIFFSDHDTELE